MHFDLENALSHETLSLITKWEKKENYDAKVQKTSLNTSKHVKIRVLLEKLNQQEMCI